MILKILSVLALSSAPVLPTVFVDKDSAPVFQDIELFTSGVGASSTTFVNDGVDVVNNYDSGGYSVPFSIFRDTSLPVGYQYSAVTGMRLSATGSGTFYQRSGVFIVTFGISYDEVVNYYEMPQLYVGGGAVYENIDTNNRWMDGRGSSFYIVNPQIWGNSSDVYTLVLPMIGVNTFADALTFIPSLSINVYFLYSYYDINSTNALTVRFFPNPNASSSTISTRIDWNGLYLKSRVLNVAVDNALFDLAEVLTVTMSNRLQQFYNDGYSDGYSQGILDGASNNNIITSVIFVTIGAFAQFLGYLSNFQVFGISITTIVTFLVAIGLTFLILKLVF